jgi:predicted house-cleaning noncanonical NTP pyrophosphatase (MazG superfamily)
MTNYVIDLIAAMETSDKILNILDEAECSNNMKMAIIPTLFEHICEKCGFNKKRNVGLVRKRNQRRKRRAWTDVFESEAEDRGR